MNLLVLRLSLAGNPTFREVVARARRVGLDAVDHAGLPFDRLVRELAASGSGDHHPLATVGIGMQPTMPDPPAPPGWRAETVPQDPGVSRFDLNVDFSPGDPAAGRAPGFAVEYDTSLFDEETIRDLVTRIRRVLAAVLADPDLRRRDLPILLDRERVPVIGSGPVAAPPGPVSRTLVRGAIPGGRLITPAGMLEAPEIGRRVEALARRLGRRGAMNGEIVAIRCDEGPALPIAVLAVLRTGAAFAPLPPGIPESRAEAIVRRAGIGITVSGDLDDMAVTGTGHDRVGRDGAAQLPDPGDIPDDSPAYLLHTSGSTGTPKGVLVPRRALATMLDGVRTRVGMGPDTVFLEVSPFAFDTATWGLLAPFHAGGTLVVATPEQRRDPQAILRLMRTHGVDMSEATPGWWSLLAEAAGTGGLSGVTALAAGEELPAEVVSALRLAGAAPWNLYGPTEATVFATCDRCGDGVAEPPIGIPLPGVSAHVLDDALRVVADNALGELHLGGPQLAEGYAGLPDLTAASFIPHPHVPHERLYRTGDLVRRGRDGRLRYVGRRDAQLQVRGHRIEPAEIISALLREPGVREAAVRIHARGESRILVAYVCGPPPSEDATSLIRALRGVLPDYMVPHRVMVLDALPRTVNGKVDLRALPEPPMRRSEPPAGEDEKLLAELLGEILDIPSPGRTEPFISLGGDSIAAIRLATRATDRGLPLTVRDVLEAGGIAEMAAAARERAAHPGSAAESAGADRDPGSPDPDPEDAGFELSGLDPGQLDRLLEEFDDDDETEGS